MCTDRLKGMSIGHEYKTCASRASLNVHKHLYRHVYVQAPSDGDGGAALGAAECAGGDGGGRARSMRRGSMLRAGRTVRQSVVGAPLRG